MQIPMEGDGSAKRLALSKQLEDAQPKLDKLHADSDGRVLA